MLSERQNGKLTTQRIPTLEEPLAVSKNKILINLDKSYKIFNRCFKVVKKNEYVRPSIV